MGHKVDESKPFAALTHCKTTGIATMSKKIKEVMVPIVTDQAFRDAIKDGCVFMEVYSKSWGRCVCYKATIQKLYFEFMDCMKFHIATVEDIKSLQAEGFECIEPVFLLYKDGKRFKTFVGINGPQIEAGLREVKEACEAA